MQNSRSKILSIALTFCFIIVSFRFFYWQVLKAPELKEKAKNQTYKLEKLLPERGKIYSSDNFPLVLNQTTYQLSLYKPNFKEDLDKILDQIEQTYPNFKTENSESLEKFKNNPNQKWITFNSALNEKQKNTLYIPGIEFQKIEKRFYPENSMAKDILGAIGKDLSGNQIGYGGLEAFYQKQLQGKTGFVWGPQDATGKTILNKKSWSSDAVNGRNIFTNINRSAQFYVEKLLQKGINEFSADSGSITIIEPKTGAVLAMASLTATNSATISSIRNPAISNLFEPGSIFKPLIVSMALDTKAIDTNYICTKCNQPHTIGKYNISNWDSEFHADSSLRDIIKNSDNIGMSYIIAKLGLNNFLNYYQKLGLTQKTGIDLQGEAKPTVKTEWPEIDLATASFGQGIVVTQIGMLQAFNTIANDGILVKPKVVSYFTENDKIIKNKNQKEIQVFNQQTIKDIKSILKYSVENGVVAKMKPENLEVCAKSGTAQVAISGSYENNSSTIASYIGFSPCYNPKFTMIVTINNPKTSPWGSSTAAPIWYELASKLNDLL
ncbi:MAG: penicillin-binding protein 2 [Candidatus Shapirobacteria bacterium]|nr:penicillin-binding protein 2 [Candidatus Shapirobacteria bacterium]MDD4383259.1 penicillin-binding protein 2 [Candidatus Shapirobacteria bacterium]